MSDAGGRATVQARRRCTWLQWSHWATLTAVSSADRGAYTRAGNKPGCRFRLPRAHRGNRRWFRPRGQCGPGCAPNHHLLGAAPRFPPAPAGEHQPDLPVAQAAGVGCGRAQRPAQSYSSAASSSGVQPPETPRAPQAAAGPVARRGKGPSGHWSRPRHGAWPGGSDGRPTGSAPQ